MIYTKFYSLFFLNIIIYTAQAINIPNINKNGEIQPDIIATKSSKYLILNNFPNKLIITINNITTPITNKINPL